MNTTTNTNDIHSRAMLVKLNVSCWNARRFDRDVTEDTNRAHGANSDAGRYNKHLLGGKQHAPEHAETMNKAAAMRQAFYKETLPWTDEGWRLLPTANYDSFTDTMRNAKLTFEHTVETFLAEYPALKAKAALLLNSMYNEAEYPSESDLREKFACKIDFSPVPSAGDFRIDLPADQLTEIERQTQARVKHSVGVAMEDAWRRLADAAAKVRERLTGTGKNGKPKVFRNSMIENIRDLVDVLSRLNVTNDPKLDAMRERIANELAELDPEELRTNVVARTTAAGKADEILKAMSGVYGG